jgi:hypothetical protein
VGVGSWGRICHGGGRNRHGLWPVELSRSIIEVTPHTSHLTPHTSHLTPGPHTWVWLVLTPHTSHLTPHTSHLTPHTSHESHLTPHTSHLTPHTSHLTPHTSGCPLSLRFFSEKCPNSDTSCSTSFLSHTVNTGIGVSQNGKNLSIFDKN